MDLGGFFGILERFERKKAGKEVGKKESEESEPSLPESDGEGKGEKPVAVSDPFAFGNEVESEISAGENKNGEDWLPNKLGGKTGSDDSGGGFEGEKKKGEGEGEEEKGSGEFAIETVVDGAENEGESEEESGEKDGPIERGGGI